jgi:hypothetical protein
MCAGRPEFALCDTFQLIAAGISHIRFRKGGPSALLKRPKPVPMILATNSPGAFFFPPTNPAFLFISPDACANFCAQS